MNTRVNLRKILGWETSRSVFVPQPDRPRVPGGRGVAWLDGYGEHGRVPDVPDNPSVANPSDIPPASNPPFVLREVTGLGFGGSRNCVNVRLDGVVPRESVPERWTDLCTPPVPDPCRVEMLLFVEPNKLPIVVPVSSVNEGVRVAYRHIKMLDNVLRGQDHPLHPPIREIVRYPSDSTPQYEAGKFYYPDHNPPSEPTDHDKKHLSHHIGKAFDALGHCSPGVIGPTDHIYHVRLPHFFENGQWQQGDWYNGRTVVERAYIDSNGELSVDKVYLYAGVRVNGGRPIPERGCAHEVVLTADGFKAACDDFAGFANDYDWLEPRTEIRLWDENSRLVRFKKNGGEVEIWREADNSTVLVDLTTFLARRI